MPCLRRMLISVVGRNRTLPQLTETYRLPPAHLTSILLSRSSSSSSHDDDSTIFPGEFWQRFEGDKNDNCSETKKKYKNILHLNAAHSYESLVSSATREFTEQLRIPFRLKEVDLWKELNHYDSGYAVSKLRMLQGSGTPADAEKMEPVFEMAEEINLVDVLLVSTPMWNYSLPYVLKQYIDIVIQPGINFKEKKGESPKAVRPGRPLMLITSAGGAGNPDRDYLTPYLKLIFGLVGFDKCHHVNMCGASKMTRQQILGEKSEEIKRMALQLESDAANERPS